MKQHINLLNDLPKWEKAQYPFNFIIGINAVLLLLLMTFYFLFYFEFHTKSTIMNAMLFQHKIASKQLEQLQANIIKTSKMSESDSKYKTFLYNQFRKHSTNGTHELYQTLNILGNKINAGIWLNQINIEKFNTRISLTGFAIEPQNAMSYVAALNTSPLFAKSHIKLENIRNISSKNYLFVRLTNQYNSNKAIEVK